MDAPVTKSPITLTAKALIPGADGLAKITVLFGALKDSPFSNFAVKVSGADIRIIEPLGTNIDAKRAAIPMTLGSAITITLGNLVASQPVSFQAVWGDDSKPIGEPMTLPIMPIIVVTK